MPGTSKPETQLAVEAGYLDLGSQKALVNRLSRVEGHVRSIKKMVEDRRCVDEILLQVAAVKAGLNQFATTLIEQELKSCVESCMDGQAEERLDRISRVLSTLLKQS